MTIEKNHIENFLESALILRNYAGDFAFLRTIYQQESSPNFNEISLFSLSLKEAADAVFNFAREVKKSDDLGRNYFLIFWLKIGSDLDEVLNQLQAIKFLDEDQKNNAVSGISRCRKIFVSDFWESLLLSIIDDRARFLAKVAILN
jgi:hypothetical protein